MLDALCPEPGDNVDNDACGGGNRSPSIVVFDFFNPLGGGKILLLNGDVECLLNEEIEGNWFIDVRSLRGGKAETEAL